MVGIGRLEVGRDGRVRLCAKGSPAVTALPALPAMRNLLGV
jgi:hypothetical protein